MTDGVDRAGRVLEANGLAVHHRRDGSGQPLVLLHSNGASAAEFDAVVGELAGSATILRPDLPGFGRTPALDGPFEIGRVADVVAEFIEELDLGPVVIVGTSLGGTVAADVAARYPTGVRGVGLVETPCRSDAQWARIWPLVERTFSTPTQSLDDIDSRFRQATPDLLARWNADRQRAGGDVMMEAMWAIRRHDVRATVQHIKVPCLLLFGAEGAVGDGVDELVGAAADEVRVVLDDCGHFPMIDDPAAFAGAITRFLRRVAT